MKIKTKDLSGHALNYAVALAEGFDQGTYMKNVDLRYDTQGKVSCMMVPVNRAYEFWYPSQDWKQGGPIIEREKIATIPTTDTDRWKAYRGVSATGYPSHVTIYGPTPLIAAMRCYVAHKLGDEVEIKESLL